MEKRIRLKEARAFSEKNGKIITNFDIAKRLYPYSNETTQRQSIWKMDSGITKTYTIEQIEIINEMTGFPIHDLLGIKEANNEDL